MMEWYAIKKLSNLHTIPDSQGQEYSNKVWEVVAVMKLEVEHSTIICIWCVLCVVPVIGRMNVGLMTDMHSSDFHFVLV